MQIAPRGIEATIARRRPTIARERRTIEKNICQKGTDAELINDLQAQSAITTATLEDDRKKYVTELLKPYCIYCILCILYLLYFYIYCNSIDIFINISFFNAISYDFEEFF